MAEAQTLHGELRQRLAGHVHRLAGDIGERNVFRPDALHAAAAYIEEVWGSQGYTVRQQTYEVRGVESANLEVACTGERRPEAILLLGAHYDSVLGSPGADDNASGVAAVLELARMFMAAAPAFTVRCVCFVNEEPPFFISAEQGSLVYADAARRRRDDIRLMLSLEMLGYYDDTPGSQRYPPLLRWFYPAAGNFIAFVSNLRSGPMLKRLATHFRGVSNFPAEFAALPSFVPGVAWSDHRSFWQHGYRALMVTDTAFYRYRWYHGAGDTPDKIDYRRLAEVTQGLFDAVMALADDLSR